MNSHIEIGNASERVVLDLLLSFDTVECAERDVNNSKYDIFFSLKSDSRNRGLQVKTMGVVTKRPNNFTIGCLDKYTDGTLIVCVHPEQYGIICIMSDTYRIVTASATVNGTSAYSKILQTWGDFVIKLKDSLTSSQIIHDIRSTMTKDHVKSYESTQRFISFCKIHNLEYKGTTDASDTTDIIVNGKKLQLKYSSSIENNKYSYRINLERTNYTPYKEGDNDFYAIEVGGFHGEFLIIPEQELIDRGHISRNEYKGITSLNVFHETYIECRKLISTQPWQVRGNWTSNPDLWYNNDRKPYILIDNLKPPTKPPTRTIAEYLHWRISGKTLLSIQWDNQSKIIPPQQINYKTYIEHTPYKITAVTSHNNSVFFHLHSLRDDYKMYIHSYLHMIAAGLLDPTAITHLSLQFGKAILLPQHYLDITESSFYFDNNISWGNFNLLTMEEYQTMGIPAN